MKLKYGTYDFDANTTLISAHQETRINAGGQPVSQIRQFTIQGFLSGSGQADLTQKENALKTALAKPYQDLLFLQDSGQNSSEILTNAGSITGVVIVDGPHFDSSYGAEYSTERRFSFTAKAEYPLANTSQLYLSFHERLVFSGGLPIFAHRLSINGPPQKQLIYPQSVFTVEQAGEASGYLGYPAVPPPKFPQALKEAPRISKDSPTRRGRGYDDFKVSWSYLFESAVPLVAIPTIWLR